MIEILGAGVPRGRDGWLLHRICTQIESSALTVVLSDHADERAAFLDVISGKHVPDEGRVWVDHLPLMKDTRHRVRARVADVDPARSFDESRSVYWNLARRPPRLGGLIRMPRTRDRAQIARVLETVGLAPLTQEPVRNLDDVQRLRLVLATGLLSAPGYVAVRDLGAMKPADTVAAAADLKRLTGLAPVGVVAAASRLDPFVTVADRVLRLADGLLVYDGPPRGVSPGPPGTTSELST
jgi:iron complex transport system ATP-binding protein